MEMEERPGTWKLVAGAYTLLLVAFGCARLAIISSARDPYLWSIELPRTLLFQSVCGVAACLLGLAGLLCVGFIADRGTGKQLIVAMMVLPLVLILLEAVNMDF